MEAENNSASIFIYGTNSSTIPVGKGATQTVKKVRN